MKIRGEIHVEKSDLIYAFSWMRTKKKCIFNELNDDACDCIYSRHKN